MEQLTDFLNVVKNYNTLVDERNSLNVKHFLKNLESCLIDILIYADKLPEVKLENPDFEAINYHSYTIEFTISKIDEEETTDNILMWREMYKSIRKKLLGSFDSKIDDRTELRLVNISDTIATIYVKFKYIKNTFGEDEGILHWTYKYGYETDFGDDIEYLLEILPGFRNLLN